MTIVDATQSKHGARYSPQDVEFIRLNRGILTHKEIAKSLGRTHAAIDIKCNKMGVSKKNQTSGSIDISNLSQHDIGFIAAAIECDGFISFGDNGKGCLRVQIGFVNTSLKLVEHIRAILKFDGRIYKRYPNDTGFKGYKAQYRLCIRRREHVLPLLKAIFDSLVSKQNKANAVIQRLEDNMKV